MGILQKKCRTTGKKGPGVQGKRCPKYRYCFSYLKVRGGPLPSKKGPNVFFLSNNQNQRRRDDNKNKIFACEGGGPPRQKNILKVQILLSRNLRKNWFWETNSVILSPPDYRKKIPTGTNSVILAQGGTFSQRSVLDETRLKNYSKD